MVCADDVGTRGDWGLTMSSGPRLASAGIEKSSTLPSRRSDENKIRPLSPAQTGWLSLPAPDVRCIRLACSMS